MGGPNGFESNTYCALHSVRVGMGYIKIVTVTTWTIWAPVTLPEYVLLIFWDHKDMYIINQSMLEVCLSARPSFSSSNSFGFLWTSRYYDGQIFGGIYDCNVQLHHAQPWYNGQVRGSVMPLLPFQSGCKARIQMVRPYSNLPYPVAVRTRPCHLNVPYCHQLFVPQHYLAPFLVFRPYRRHTTCVL